MPIVILQLPEVKENEESRPEKCPKCPGNTFQRWGGEVRKIKDPQIKEVVVYRYQCCRCGYTFRHYPEGISRAQQSERMKKLAAISWSRGLSHRGVSLILTAFGVLLSHMSSWRDVQAEGEIIQSRIQWKTARIAGIDGAWLNGEGMMVAVDMGNGQLISVGQIDEKDAAPCKTGCLISSKSMGLLPLSLMICLLIVQLLKNWSWIIRFASFMYADGWGELAINWLKSCPKNGYGYWKRSNISWRICLLTAPNDFCSFTKNCLAI